MDDFRNFARLSQSFSVMDSAGGIVCEPELRDQRGERARRPRLDDHAEKCACPLDGLASRLLWRGHGSPFKVSHYGTAVP